jgi:hypothetical protein
MTTTAVAPAEPRPAPASTRRIRLDGRALTFAAGLGASLPIALSTFRALRDGWVPFGDQAVIATRAYDVFSEHAPLVGQYSSSSHVAHHTAYSLGPLLYWLLAPVVRLGPPGAIALTMGVVNVACVLGTVALARRRGGLALMLATAFAVAVMCRSLIPETLHDPWNPSAAVVPFALLIFLCWSVACGEHRLLPLTVLTASYVAQCHLAYLLPAVGMLLVAVVAARRFRRRWRWWVAALAVGVLCWTPPLIDEISHHPGNLTVVVRAGTASQPTVGWTDGWHAVARTFGVPPWWATVPTSPWDRLAEVQRPAGTLATASAIAVLAGLAAALGIGLWRRRADIASAAAIAAVLAASIAAATAHTPTDHVLMSTLGYTLWLASPAGMAAWLILGWAALAVLPRLRPRPRLRFTAAAAALAAVLAVGAAVAAGQQPDLHRSMYRPVAALSKRVEATVPGGQTIWLDGSPGLTTVLRAGVRYDLRRHGVRALAHHAADRVGAWYDLAGRRYTYAVYIQDNDKFPKTQGRVVGRVTWMDGGVVHRLTVRVWRPRGGSAIGPP